VNLPGGIGVSHLRVYDAGGTPHLHTACREAYAVVAGRGAVQTLTLAEGFRHTPLAPGMLVSFPPGTIHRLLNDGDLEIFVLMANAGLPEAGDMVITFEPAILADPSHYAEAAAVPSDDAGVERRRVSAVAGFEAIRHGGPEALAGFHRAAARLVGPSVDSWRRIWADGSRAAAEATGRHLDALAAGDVAHFGSAAVDARPPSDSRRYGCCGTLGTYLG
jgi:mannose-6-phosphate isomerase-like protein (cupin superfamily)